MALAAGANFADAGNLLAVLVVAAGSVFFGSLFGHAVVAMGLQKKTVWIYAIAAAISLALYFVAIPRFGAWGAAGVTIFSELFVAVTTFAVVARKANFRPSPGPILKAVSAAVPMVGLLFLTGSWPLIPRALAAAGLYILFAIAFRAIRYQTLLDFVGRGSL